MNNILHCNGLSTILIKYRWSDLGKASYRVGNYGKVCRGEGKKQEVLGEMLSLVEDLLFL